MWRNWRVATLVAMIAAAAPTPAVAQDAEITEAILELFFKARRAESAEQEKTDPQIKALDEKISKFNECKKDIEAAGSAGGRLAALAARAAIKNKCGASNDEGMQKERAALVAAPEKAALTAGGFKPTQYSRLKDRLAAFLGGDRESFDAKELAALNARRAEISRMLGVSVARSGAGVGDPAYVGARSDDDERSGRRSRGTRGMRGGWTPDLAWTYIGDMFEVMYLSGAMMFEKPYEAGQWTRWELSESDVPDEKRTIERALIAKTPEGNEWWRTKSITQWTEDGTVKADTMVMEALFKPAGEYLRQMVRVRAKFPGDAESKELMVPEHWGTLSLMAFPYKPTPESIEGATVGTEKVSGVDAKHIKFGGSDGGTIEWWLSDALPGGWARFRQTDGDVVDANGKPVIWTMQLMGHGKGAKSELGVIK